MKTNLLAVFLFCTASLALEEELDSDTLSAGQEVERRVWDPKALEWHRFVGVDGQGDLNRLVLSDPELLELLGRDLFNKVVLDMGCGNGYLSRKLAAAGAKVIAVDVSPEMIKLAEDVSCMVKSPLIDFRIDNVEKLQSILDASIDHIVANYVLMDVFDLNRTLASMYRVLKPGGTAIIVMLHPCFPLNPAIVTEENGIRTSRWKKSYFIPHNQFVSLEGFSTEFLVYHRSLEYYEKAFSEAKFVRDPLREPHLTEQQKERFPKLVDKFGDHPLSIAFRLRKIELSDENSKSAKLVKNRFKHVHQVGTGKVQNQIAGRNGLQVKGNSKVVGPANVLLTTRQVGLGGSSNYLERIEVKDESVEQDKSVGRLTGGTQAFDLNESKRVFNDNPTGYIAGGVSSFIASVACGQAIQYLWARAASAIPGIAIFRARGTWTLHAVTMCDPVERLVALYTGHAPFIINLNPTAYAASFLTEKFDVLGLKEDAEGSKWNQAFERGQRDFALVSTVFNGVVSFCQLAAGVRTWFKDPRESQLGFKTMSLSKTSKVRVGSIHSHGNSEWSLWRGSDNKKALYADIQGILDSVGDGWRLPTIKELKSYYNSDRPRTQQFRGQYWSTKENLFFDFTNGKKTNCKPGHKAKILLVRDKFD